MIPLWLFQLDLHVNSDKKSRGALQNCLLSLWSVSRHFIDRKGKGTKRDINDPLGQTHSPTSSDCYSRLKFVLFCDILKSNTYRRHAKIVITTCLDCGSGLVDQKEGTKWWGENPHLSIHSKRVSSRGNYLITSSLLGRVRKGVQDFYNL